MAFFFKCFIFNSVYQQSFVFVLFPRAWGRGKEKGRIDDAATQIVCRYAGMWASPRRTMDRGAIQTEFLEFSFSYHRRLYSGKKTIVYTLAIFYHGATIQTPINSLRIDRSGESGRESDMVVMDHQEKQRSRTHQPSGDHQSYSLAKMLHQLNRDSFARSRPRRDTVSRTNLPGPGALSGRKRQLLALASSYCFFPRSSWRSYVRKLSPSQIAVQTLASDSRFW